ncbi:transposase [Bacillus salacetis]|uniref:Transposase n=1 Tax=Bacillus salacetis TaxID=2315464 RepID=A0A3A1RDQ2_9BACI|nr:transposase [Bacillus salacetis]
MDKFSLDHGRPSIAPVVMNKMVFIQHLFGIRSICQTIKEIETNVSYGRFIGYSYTEKVPHFSNQGKNYIRQFHDTD